MMENNIYEILCGMENHKMVTSIDQQKGLNLYLEKHGMIVKKFQDFKLHKIQVEKLIHIM